MTGRENSETGKVIVMEIVIVMGIEIRIRVPGRASWII